MPPKAIYKKRASLAVILSLIGLFIGWIVDTTNQLNKGGITETEPSELEGAQSISGIAYVTDGDSVKIDKKPIRLLGIDAPELKQKCLDKDYIEYNCGEISANFLKNLIAGKNIICYYQQKDIYNRYLGICYLDKLNINQEILIKGMAIIYNPATADKKLKQLESEAKANKAGIWQGSFLEPKEYRKKNKHKTHERKN